MKLISSQANKDNLCIVVLKRAYDSIQDDATLRLLGKIARLKIQSYRREYPYGILPVDSVDYAGDHLLLCEKTSDGFEPLMGFKVVTHSACKLFHLEFPAFHILDGEELHQHRLALAELLDQARRQRQEVAYIGSWTFRPDLKADPKMVQFCYDLTVAMLVHYFQDAGIPFGITFASLRFKVDRFHRFMGLEEFGYKGQPLPKFNSKAFFEEPSSASLLRTASFSAEAIRLSQLHAFMWKNRVVIAGEGETGDQRKAA